MGGAENGFSKVIYNGNTGYALSSYLSPDAVVGNGTEKVYEVVNCQESITLRTSPSTSASEICQIPLGETVIFYGEARKWILPGGVWGEEWLCSCVLFKKSMNRRRSFKDEGRRSLFTRKSNRFS